MFPLLRNGIHHKKSLPEIAALEGFSFRSMIAFSGQLELLRNNQNNRDVYVSNRHIQATPYKSLHYFIFLIILFGQCQAKV